MLVKGVGLEVCTCDIDFLSLESRKNEFSRFISLTTIGL